MTAAERPEDPQFLQMAAVGGLMLAMAATPLAAARFAENPYFLLTLKWAVAAILVLPAAAVLILGSPTLGRARVGDGVVAAWFGLGVLATAGAEAFAPAVTRLAEMTTVAAAYFITSRVADRGLVRSCFPVVVLPVAALVACYSIAQHLGANPLGFVSEGEDQLCASFVNRNLLAGFLAFALPITLDTIVAARRPEPRAAALAAAVPIGAALILSETRGAWIASGVVFVVWLLMKGRSLRAAPLVAVLLGSLVAVSVAVNPEGASGPSSPGRSKSARERVMMWRIGADLVRERPLLGWGPGNFDTASERKKAPYFRENENRATVELPRFAHSDAVELSTEMGVPGAILWLGLMGALARRVLREWSSEGGGIALACVAVAIHGLFHWSLHDPVVSLLFFAGLGATAPLAPSTEPLRPWVAWCVKLAIALVVAVTLLHVTRTMASRALYERGAAQQRAGQLHEALWTFRNAGTLDPDFAEAQAQRASVLAETGFPYDALRVLKAARALDMHNEGILLNMGLLHEGRGSLASARECLEEAREGNPNLAEAYLALSRIAHAESRFDHSQKLRDEGMELLQRQRRGR